MSDEGSAEVIYDVHTDFFHWEKLDLQNNKIGCHGKADYATVGDFDTVNIAVDAECLSLTLRQGQAPEDNIIDRQFYAPEPNRK